MLSCVQALAGLEITLELGVDRLRAYSLEQKALLVDLLALRGVKAEGGGERHGAFVTVTHPQAVRLAKALAERGVVGDARGDKLRLCQSLESALGSNAEAIDNADWQAKWSALPSLGNDYERALQGRFNAALSATDGQRSAYAQELERMRRQAVESLEARADGDYRLAAARERACLVYADGMRARLGQAR